MVDSNFPIMSISAASLPKVKITRIVLSGDTGCNIELFEVSLQVGSLRSNHFHTLRVFLQEFS